MNKTDSKILILISVILLSIFTTGCKKNTDEDIITIDGVDEHSVLISVNDSNILVGEFLEEYNNKRTEYIKDFGKESLDLVKNDTIEFMIFSKLKENYLLENNITITEEEIDNRIIKVKNSPLRF